MRMHANGDVKIFAGSTGRPFARRMCEYIGCELGDSEVITFSDGNIFVRIKETVRDKDVYIVQPIKRTSPVSPFVPGSAQMPLSRLGRIVW